MTGCLQDGGQPDLENYMMMEKNYLDSNLGTELYYYGTHLNCGCVPRFVVTLKMPIDGDNLVKTMADIKDRFPQMAVKIGRTADNKKYTLEDNLLPFCVFHDKGNVIRNIGTSETNWHLLSVTYYKKTLMFDFHHLLGDGTGFIIFIKAVLYRYFQRIDVPVQNDGTIWTVAQPYNMTEGEEPYQHVRNAETRPPRWNNDQLEPFCVPKISDEEDPADTVVLVRIPFNRLRGVFKQYDSSPVTFISPLFSHAIFEKYEDVIDDRTIFASVPVNLRPYFPTDTVRYFITLSELAYSRKLAQEDIEDLLRIQKSLLDDQTSKEVLAYRAQNHIESMRQLRQMDMSLDDKIGLMDHRIRTSMLKYTFVITNMGRIALPETMSQYISDFYPVLPTSLCPFTIASTTWGNELVLCITQRMKDLDVCDRFVKVLNRMGIPAYISDSYQFHTMKCKPV